jgi:peptidoglycan/LPS O-acetylase OafA/YrhL
VHYAVYRKASSSSMKHSNKSFFGFILLIVTSVLSLYWGALAIEGTLHTFDWFILALACMFSFVFGIIGAILVLRKKLQPLAIFAPIIPLLINTIIVKSALDSYQLSNPWLMLFASTVLSAVCIFFVAGSDEAFKKPEQAL